VFTGLPSPAAAGLIVSVVAFHPEAPVGTDTAVLVTVVLVLAAALMVSPIPYASFKTPSRVPRPRTVVLVTLPMVVLVALEPTATLLVATWAYAASGPVRALADAVSSAPDGPPAP
jgi:CDP-diacylglycerol---serine O-phosphatidyltransferase